MAKFKSGTSKSHRKNLAKKHEMPWICIPPEKVDEEEEIEDLGFIYILKRMAHNKLQQRISRGL